MISLHRLLGLTLAVFLLVTCQPAGSQSVPDASVIASQLRATEKMDKQEFWRIIDFAHTQAKSDEGIQERLLISILAKYSPAAIVEFECLLEQQLQTANTYSVMAAEKIIDDYVSDDSFLYFRCWLVAQGEKTFAEALQNPDAIADKVDKGAATEFEPLLYVTTTAYQRKTGKQQADNGFPREVAGERGLGYDTSAGPSGLDWTLEQLPKRLPKLWAKFR